MKKIAMFVIVSALFCSLCACSKSFEKPIEKRGSDTGNEQKIKGVEMLCNAENLKSCYTNEGYYYLAEDVVELKNGEYGTQLMYMDFATQQEIFLCSNTGCKHNTVDCPAVFTTEEFPTMSSGIFVYKDKVFILSKPLDEEGAVTQEYSIDVENNSVEEKTQQTILYQMNMDGTNRHKVYTFDAGLIVEDIVLGSNDGLYFVTKKLSTTMEKGNDRVATSSDRTLVFLDKKFKNPKEICSLESEDGIMWKISGCFQNKLVLEGVDYGKKLTVDDYTLNDDAWNELYKNSGDIIAVLDLNTSTLDKKYRFDNSREHSMAVIDNILYISYADEKEIKSIHLENGEEKTLCSLPQNLIVNTFDNILCCRNWDLASDYTYYFVDKTTGEIQHSPLVNKSLGWSLEFKAEVGSRVLVIHDYEFTPLDDDAYDITQYKYALIEKEDLYTGNANYHPIKMSGKGR